jgi:hypothetical protein
MFSRTFHRFSPDGPPRQGKRSRASCVLPRLLAVTLAALIALPLAEATQPVAAGKDKKFKTITRTISSNGQVAIPAAGTEGPANPYPTTIKVDAFKKFKKAKIKDVNLTLHNVDHTLPDNIDVMLALGGRQATVLSDVGGSTDAVGLTLTLDDEAGTELPDASALSSGTFRPANFVGFMETGDVFAAPAPAQNGNVALSTFNNARPDGTWQLFVHDDFSLDTGNIVGGWTLEITAKVKDKDSKNDSKKDKKDGKKDKKDQASPVPTGDAS